MVWIKEIQFPAIAIRSINMNLALPGISEVAQAFREKGYELADKTLHLCGDKIEDIKLLLGNDNVHLVPQSDVLFGDNSTVPPSVYLDSPLGVMLVGDIERYKQNLALLPEREKTFSEFSCSYSSSPTFQGEGSSETGKYTYSDYEKLDLPAQVNISVLNDNCQIVDSELEKAAEEILSSQAKDILNYDNVEYNEEFVEENDTLVKFALQNSSRDSDRRLVIPSFGMARLLICLAKTKPYQRQY